MRVIAGDAGGVRLLTPEGMQTRPTIERVKEAIFSSVHFRLPGMRVLEYAGGDSYHGKSLVIDDDISIIGSYNLDLRSTYVDTELMLVIRGRAFNAQLRRDMDALRSACRRVIDDEAVEVPEGLEIPPLSPFRRAALWIVGHLVQPVRNLV